MQWLINDTMVGQTTQHWLVKKYSSWQKNAMLAKKKKKLPLPCTYRETIIIISATTKNPGHTKKKMRSLLAEDVRAPSTYAPQ